MLVQVILSYSSIYDHDGINDQAETGGHKIEWSFLKLMWREHAF